MTKRTLILLQPGSTPTPDEIRSYEEQFDELIFVLLWESFERTTERGHHPGNVLVETKLKLQKLCSRPFYLLPLDAHALDPHAILIRLSHLLPTFQHVASVYRCFIKTAKLMGKETSPTTPIGLEEINDHSHISRALYITRAQPFHNGHAEFIEHILAHHDEAILAIACTDQALTLSNPATAGERMEMIGSYIHPRYNDRNSNRVWIVPFSHTPYMMEKIKNIQWLMPKFTHIYGSNPAHLLMGQVEGLETVFPQMKCSVRATEVRERLIHGESIHGMVPEEIEQKMYELGIDKRLKFLSCN